MTFKKIALTAVLASMTAMPLHALDLNVSADAGVSADADEASTGLALGTGVGAELGTDEGTLSADATIGADVEAGTDGVLDGETLLATDTAAGAEVISEDGDLALAVAGGSVLSSDELNLGTVSDVSVSIDGSDSLMVAVNSDLGLNVDRVSITDDNFTVLADGSVMIDMTQDEFMAAVAGSASAMN